MPPLCTQYPGSPKNPYPGSRIVSRIPYPYPYYYLPARDEWCSGLEFYVGSCFDRLYAQIPPNHWCRAEPTLRIWSSTTAHFICHLSLNCLRAGLKTHRFQIQRSHVLQSAISKPKFHHASSRSVCWELSRHTPGAGLEKRRPLQ